MHQFEIHILFSLVCAQFSYKANLHHKMKFQGMADQTASHERNQWITVVHKNYNYRELQLIEAVPRQNWFEDDKLDPLNMGVINDHMVEPHCFEEMEVV